MNFDVIVPCYGACEGIALTLDSIQKQTYSNPQIHVCFDSVDPDSERGFINEYRDADNISFYLSEPRRLFALENILRVLDSLSEDSIIGIVDCGDFLFRRD